MTVNSIYKLLDKLEIMVLKGLPIPLTPFVIVHHEKVIDILDKIRAAIPGEIQEACGILKRREEIQAETQNKVNQLMGEAKYRAEQILSESELLNAVQSEAEKIRQQVISDCEEMKKQAIVDVESIKANAYSEAQMIKDGANKYAENILADLDKNLTHIHSIVKNGQSHMISSKTPEQNSNSRMLNSQQYAYEQQKTQK
ncbi:MAG: hypothetical protein PHV68_04205 [Candidatus Gastranaerophilales bacterium]|nr:hypothetical protein [Candidatus Gastranaerophilales bacterium]